MIRLLLLATALLAGCNQPDDTEQLDRIEALLNRIENRHDAPQLPAPMSEEEYEQIPAGTKFLAPDGTVREKQKAPAP